MKNTPGRIRTCDLRIRNPLLYPTELRAHKFKVNKCTNFTYFVNPNLSKLKISRLIIHHSNIYSVIYDISAGYPPLITSIVSLIFHLLYL